MSILRRLFALFLSVVLFFTPLSVAQFGTPTTGGDAPTVFPVVADVPTGSSVVGSVPTPPPSEGGFGEEFVRQRSTLMQRLGCSSAGECFELCAKYPGRCSDAAGQLGLRSGPSFEGRSHTTSFYESAREGATDTAILSLGERFYPSTEELSRTFGVNLEEACKTEEGRADLTDSIVADLQYRNLGQYCGSSVPSECSATETFCKSQARSATQNPVVPIPGTSANLIVRPGDSETMLVERCVEGLKFPVVEEDLRNECDRLYYHEEELFKEFCSAPENQENDFCDYENIRKQKEACLKVGREELLPTPPPRKDCVSDSECASGYYCKTETVCAAVDCADKDGQLRPCPFNPPCFTHGYCSEKIGGIPDCKQQATSCGPGTHTERIETFEAGVKCSAFICAPDRKEECACSADYSPVCGVNGVTYPNSCSASCVGVKVAKPGACDYVPTPTYKHASESCSGSGRGGLSLYCGDQNGDGKFSGSECGPATNTLNAQTIADYFNKAGKTLVEACNAADQTYKPPYLSCPKGCSYYPPGSSVAKCIPADTCFKDDPNGWFVCKGGPSAGYSESGYSYYMENYFEPSSCGGECGPNKELGSDGKCRYKYASTPSPTYTPGGNCPSQCEYWPPGATTFQCVPPGCFRGDPNGWYECKPTGSGSGSYYMDSYFKASVCGGSCGPNKQLSGEFCQQSVYPSPYPSGPPYPTYIPSGTPYPPCDANSCEHWTSSYGSSYPGASSKVCVPAGACFTNDPSGWFVCEKSGSGYPTKNWDFLASKCGGSCGPNKVLGSDGKCVYQYSGSPSPSPSGSCGDTDGPENGGLIYKTRGTATQGSASGTDYCLSSTMLREYFCEASSGKFTSTDASCPVLGYSSCWEGACTNSPGTSTPSPSGPPYPTYPPTNRCPGQCENWDSANFVGCVAPGCFTKANGEKWLCEYMGSGYSTSSYFEASKCGGTCGTNRAPDSKGYCTYTSYPSSTPYAIRCPGQCENWDNGVFSGCVALGCFTNSRGEKSFCKQSTYTSPYSSGYYLDNYFKPDQCGGSCGANKVVNSEGYCSYSTSSTPYPSGSPSPTYNPSGTPSPTYTPRCPGQCEYWPSSSAGVPTSQCVPQGCFTAGTGEKWSCVYQNGYYSLNSYFKASECGGVCGTNKAVDSSGYCAYSSYPSPTYSSTPSPTSSAVDVSVTSVTASPSSVSAGGSVTVTAVFYNPSSTSQSVQLTIGKGASSVSDGSQMSTTYYTSLSPGSNTQSYTFVGSYGAYSPTPAPSNTYYPEASISGVPQDPNTANNYLRGTSSYTVTSTATASPSPSPTYHPSGTPSPTPYCSLPQANAWYDTAAGKCKISSCYAGSSNCNGLDADGCEVYSSSCSATPTPTSNPTPTPTTAPTPTPTPPCPQVTGVTATQNPGAMTLKVTANWNNNCGPGSNAQYSVSVSPGGASYTGIPGSSTMSTGSWQLGAANSIACTAGSNTVTVSVWASTGGSGAAATTVTCGSAGSAGRLSITGFQIASQLFKTGARAECFKALEQNRLDCQRMSTKGAPGGSFLGFSRDQCVGGTIPREAAVSACLQKKLSQTSSFAEEKRLKICKVTANKALRLAAELVEPVKECVGKADERCRFYEQRDRKCRELAGEGQVRQIAEKIVAKACSQVSTIRPRLKQVADLSTAKTVDIVASIPEKLSLECEKKMVELGVQIRDSDTILAGGSQVRIVRGDVDRSLLEKVNEETLDCAEDFRASLSLRALKQKATTNTISDLGGVAVALEALQQQLTDSDSNEALEANKVRISSASLTEESVVTTDADKTPVYSAGNLLGLNYEREIDEARRLAEASQTARETNERLLKLALSLRDSNPVEAAELEKIVAESVERWKRLDAASQERADGSRGYYFGVMSRLGLRFG